MDTCTPTTVIMRGGTASEEGLNLSVKRALSNFRKLALPVDVPVVERLFCVPELQYYDYEERLLHKSMMGFQLVTRPNTLSFGEDMSFMEHKLTENPGQFILTDNDFCYGEAHNRGLGEPFYSPEIMSLEFAKASIQANKLGLKVWGPKAHNRMGGGAAGKPALLSKKSVANGNFTVGLRYIRNFFVLTSQAKGDWKPWSYLEDCSRVLSEHAIDAGSVGQFDGMMVRYPDARTQRDYEKAKEWQQNRKSLAAEYGEPAMRLCLRGGKPPNRKD